MGRWKDVLIERLERGWDTDSEKLVCVDCIVDPYLTDYIRQNGENDLCDYCGDATDDEEGRQEVQCIPFRQLMTLIGDGINWAYRSADDEGIPYESSEGGYAFSEHMHDTYDLVVDQLEIADTESVREDIIAALPDQTWCQRGFWSLSLYDALKFGWDEFVEQVKYQTRFLFTIPKDSKSKAKTDESDTDAIEIFPSDLESSSDPDFEIGFDRQEGIPVHEMLDAIGDLLRRLDLVRIIEPGNIIYRVRVEDKGKDLHGPKDLGPPERDLAMQPNRMSPSGIVMFYGATKPETAIAETFQPKREGVEEKSVWVSPFKVLKQLRILDLTHLPKIPSIYDSTRREELNGIAFLHAFVKDLIKPIERDGREHIDYVPTQIVTEYLKQIFETEDAQQLDGILYKSSKQTQGTACVLFIDSSNCGVPVEPWREPVQVLQLLEDKVRTLDGAKASDWYPQKIP